MLSNLADMPSYKKEINVDLNSNESGVLRDVKHKRCRDVPPVVPLEGPGSERQLAFSLREFLGPANSAQGDTILSSVIQNLPYIDDQVEIDELQSDTERSRDTEEVLSNAASRLRRWRAASRKLQRSRHAGGSGAGAGRPAELMRGMSASTGQLLSLAPPPPAATAPPSPGCLLTPSLADQSSVEYFGSSPECCADGTGAGAAPGPAPPPGPRYKLVTEGTLRICCYQSTQTVVDKLTAKFLRRWETHSMYIQDQQIMSKTATGVLEKPLPFYCMQQVYCLKRWDPAERYCLRIDMLTRSLVFQAKDAYTRDKWYHSIMWRRNILKYQETISKKVKREVVIKELKKMVDYVMTTPLQDEGVTQTPMTILTNLLSEEQDSPDWEEWAVQATNAAAPLLSERQASSELCALLARLCRQRAEPLPALAPPVRRVLTRNVDFAKAPNARRLVRDYISALSMQSSGPALVRRFVEVAHGQSATCPHPRAAPNLVAVALAALDNHYRESKLVHECVDAEDEVLCFADILAHMCEYEDWLVIVSGILQSVPVSAGAMRCPRIAKRLGRVLRSIANDRRCAVHTCLAPARAARADPPSWLRTAGPSEQIIALPQNELCLLWGDMLASLLMCCSKRKSFLQSLSKQLPDFVVVAFTEHPAVLLALSLMLEWEVCSGEQTQLEIIATLKATKLGGKYYKELCERQQNLQKLQAEGGPQKLALPVNATDDDVAALLDTGAFGNLECLSLAFTSVTSECANHLIKLPSLRYLNLWSTQFGDSGLQLIAEHLPKLQILNLCETPISDKGIEALSGLSNLRRLNLNSTRLSAEAFDELKQRLPQLQEYDIRYTEAW